MIPVPSQIIKYSGNGGFGGSAWGNLPTKVTNILHEMANYSLAKNTWRSYRTAWNHVAKAGIWSGLQIQIPFNLDMTLAYVAYLRGKTNSLKTETVEKYLSGIRMIHLIEGHENVVLRCEIVNQILKGGTNMDNVRAMLERKPERLAVTVPILRLIK